MEPITNCSKDKEGSRERSLDNTFPKAEIQDLQIPKLVLTRVEDDEKLQSQINGKFKGNNSREKGISFTSVSKILLKFRTSNGLFCPECPALSLEALDTNWSAGNVAGLLNHIIIEHPKSLLLKPDSELYSPGFDSEKGKAEETNTEYLKRSSGLFLLLKHKRFLARFNLRMRKGRKVAVCPECGFRTSTIELLQLHLLAKHKRSDWLNKDVRLWNKTRTQRKKTTWRTGELICQICDKGFGHEKSLIFHIGWHKRMGHVSHDFEGGFEKDDWKSSYSSEGEISRESGVECFEENANVEASETMEAECSNFQERFEESHFGKDLPAFPKDVPKLPSPQGFVELQQADTKNPKPKCLNQLKRSHTSICKKKQGGMKRKFKPGTASKLLFWGRWRKNFPFKQHTRTSKYRKQKRLKKKEKIPRPVMHTEWEKKNIHANHFETAGKVSENSGGKENEILNPRDLSKSANVAAELVKTQEERPKCDSCKTDFHSTLSLQLHLLTTHISKGLLKL